MHTGERLLRLRLTKKAEDFLKPIFETRSFNRDGIFVFCKGVNEGKNFARMTLATC